VYEGEGGRGKGGEEEIREGREKELKETERDRERL
jgi:hypothetical protein